MKRAKRVLGEDARAAGRVGLAPLRGGEPRATKSHFLPTNHRDALVAWLASGTPGNGRRLEDGTLVVEEPRFDPLTGRVITTWYWQGPRGGGHKAATLRLYTVTELVRLVERAGLRLRPVLDGASWGPVEPATSVLKARVAVVAERG